MILPSAKFLLAAAFVGSVLIQESSCCTLLSDDQCWVAFSSQDECTSVASVGQLVCMYEARCIGFNHLPNSPDDEDPNGGTCRYVTYQDSTAQDDCLEGWSGYNCLSEYSEEMERELINDIKEHLNTLSGQQLIDMENKIQKVLGTILDGKASAQLLGGLRPTSPSEDHPLKDTAYSFTVTFPSQEAMKKVTDENYKVCLFKGATPEAGLTYIYPALSLTFSWEVQYGMIVSNQEYSAGVTIDSSTWMNVDVGRCYSVNDANQITECGDKASQYIVMKNQKTANGDEWIFGLYQNLAGTAVTEDGSHIPLLGTSSSSSVPTNIFFADSVLSGSGIVSVEPLEEVTVGLCKESSNELVISQNKAGMCTFDVPSDSIPTISFDETTNTFICPSSSVVTEQ